MDNGLWAIKKFSNKKAEENVYSDDTNKIRKGKTEKEKQKKKKKKIILSDIQLGYFFGTPDK